MGKPLLHPNNAADIERLIAHPAQAILITGKQGSGTDFVAEYLAKSLLVVDSLENQPYYMSTSKDEASISIDTIREIQKFLKLKVASQKQGTNRVILIKKAGRMGQEAQNALLKTLEEPPAGTVIILTAHKSEELLPTINSRVQTVNLLAVDKITALEYLKNQQLDTTDFEKHYALSGGGASLLVSLTKNTESDLAEYVSLAKKILSEPANKRLLRVDELSKDKAKIALLLDSMQRICHAALNTSAKKNSLSAVKIWQAKQAHVLKTIENFQKNANTKILLDSLFINV